MRRTLGRCVALLVSVVLAGACASDASSKPVATTTVAPATSTSSTSTIPVTTTTAPAASPPIDTAPRGRIPVATTTAPVATNAFSSRVATVTAADLPSSWRAGCPVGPDQLRAVHVSYWGFDDQPHTGTLIVNANAVAAIVAAFTQLFRERFPIRQIQPVDMYGGNDRASMAADNTSAFNCRPVAGSNPPRWSAHAYGQAIDVNTIENPYVQGSYVSPPAGAAFLDRSVHGRGMAFSGGDLVAAFAAVGWQWGGRWSDPDYQHFSSTGG